jgi:flagellar biosynthesis protein FlhF
MEAKKITAKDIKGAMKIAIEVLGPDAIIVSKSLVPSGVEVIAAREKDYEKAKADLLKRKGSGDINSGLDIVQFKKGGSNLPKEEMWSSYEGADKKARPSSDFMSEELPRKRENDQKDEIIFDNFRVKMEEDKEEIVKGFVSEISDLREFLSIQTEPLKELQYIRDAFESVNIRSKALSPASAVYDMLYSRMSRMGINDAIKVRMSSGIEASVPINKAWTMALSNLANMMAEGHKNPISKGGVFAFLGATGVGKTTTIGKIATQYVMDHGNENLVLVTTDAFKIASFEQLKTFGRILDLPVYTVSERDSLADIIASIDPSKTILIDTAGMSMDGDITEMQSKMIANAGVDIQKYLMLSASSQEALIEKVWDAHAKFGINGLIISKVDESSSLGQVISTSVEKQVPIFYLADGQKIPDDCHMLNNREIIILGLNVAQSETRRLIGRNTKSRTA